MRSKLSFIVAGVLAGLFALSLLLPELTAQPKPEQPSVTKTADELAIANLSAEQKQELLRRKEQFEQLAPAERERLRKLHTELSTDPAASQLTGVMTRYHDWLQTLTPLERDELLSLPTEERIDRIKRLLRQQQQERFEQMAENVPSEDMDVIFQWLGKFAIRHEDKILAGIPSEFRQRLEQIEDPERRRRMLMMAMNFRGPGSEPIMPQRADFQELLPQLSKASRDKLAAAKDPGELVKSWVKVSTISRMLPPVSEEQLMDFFKTLPAKERGELEGLSADTMRAELTKKFNHARMGKMKDSFRPSFMGGERPPFSRPGGPNDPRDPRRKWGPGGERPPGERPPPPGDRPPPRDDGPPPDDRLPIDKRPRRE